METKTAAVSMRNVTKTFGSVIANDKVNLDIYKGEILSLLGENGSGKTTLMNMLSGIYFPDEGQIFINGKEEVIRSPKDAFDLGIGMVHQHFKLIEAKRISFGGFTETAIDVRVILREAILKNATILAICHNHPSGNAVPSRADDQLTQRVQKACEVMRIHFLDHIIVCDGHYFSYNEQGRL